MYNTIIIGAGPVGSYLAAKLAQLGYKVLVLDKKAAAGQNICCTGIVGKACLDLLHVDKKLTTRQVSSATFLAPSGKPLRLWRNDEVAYIIDRPAVDQALADCAQASGVCYLFSTNVVDIRARTDCLHVTANCGEQKIFETEAAVIATGFGSSLPGKLGLGRINDFIIGAQAKANMTACDEVEIYLDQRLAPGGFAWLVPTKANRGLAGLLTNQQPKQHFKKLLSILKTQGKITSIETIQGYRAIPIRTLPKTYSERLLVVGEAAGQVKPTTGGGIYYGLLCADIAADILHRAFKVHDFSESKLAPYQKKWRSRLGRELQIGYCAHHLYKKLGNKHIEHLHNFISNNSIPQFIAELDGFSFDWHSDLMLKTLKHLAIAIPTQAIKPLIKHNTATL